MLVIPALISLKPGVIDESAPCVRLLVKETIVRLRDPAEIVAKTARKLILELEKCYPGAFQKKFIETLPNANERDVCQLILTNKVDEANKLLELIQAQSLPALQHQQQATPPTKFVTVESPPIVSKSIGQG